ncbi:DUF6527 family protein [Pseudomonas sp. BN414]|uniref:DUF6527 family protein n=1 Tax=Pseudomonas sp. BN414 TaxID=2567888 RepID=UPI002456C28D|nr:DUF6527 family protein [Pseudomonas sp. BN414]
MTVRQLTPHFVERFPEQLQPGVLYLAMEFVSAAHSCACGCGRKVITPFSPTDWQMVFDGETVSLRPSIGNWSFPCRSHYWIRSNRIEWAAAMSQVSIERGRERDVHAKALHAAAKKADDQAEQRPVDQQLPASGKAPASVAEAWGKFKAWLNL